MRKGLLFLELIFLGFCFSSLPAVFAADDYTCSASKPCSNGGKCQFAFVMVLLNW